MAVGYKIGDVYGVVYVFILHVVQASFKIVLLGKRDQQQFLRHV